jgi:hypothetical protein
MDVVVWAAALLQYGSGNSDNKQRVLEVVGWQRSQKYWFMAAQQAVINLLGSSCTVNARVHKVIHLCMYALQEGALQPVINLLGSSCAESQREAALLLGQFATQTPNDDGPDYKSRIVQRGAVPPLIRMLSSPDTALKEMAAFALGRLAQNTHNQAGIVQVRWQGLLLGIDADATVCSAATAANAAACSSRHHEAGSVQLRGATLYGAGWSSSSSHQRSNSSTCIFMHALGRLAPNTHNQAGIVQLRGPMFETQPKWARCRSSSFHISAATAAHAIAGTPSKPSRHCAGARAVPMSSSIQQQ